MSVTDRETEGFSAEWLTLREPADHAARDAAVHGAFLDHVARLDGDEFRIVDLGCGTGSTFRALSPMLAERFPDRRQVWTLADADAALLDAAKRRIEAQATTATASYEAVDLSDAVALAGLFGRSRPHVVTGSALIDLVSADWLDGLVAAAAERSIALLFALNYTGEEQWVPAHPLDASILEAFNADQRRDKGFGPALGGKAAACLAKRLTGADFAVTIGGSDWILDRDHGALVEKLVEGIAAAAVNSGRVSREDAERWRLARVSCAEVRIGHLDLFAAPPL